MMSRPIYLLAMLLLVVAFFPASAYALNDQPETAIPLTLEIAGHADQLVGDTGGAVRFYRIDYVGYAQPVKIELTASPGRNATGFAFGFKLYGPNGLVGEAPVETNEDTWTRFSMTLAGATSGAYLIQVYNYTNGMAVDFNVQVSGLTQAAIRVDEAGPTGVTADQPLLISHPSTSFDGTLVGGTEENLRYVSFDYPGANAALVVKLRYSPPSPYENNAVGFNLYHDGALVGRGSESLRDGSAVEVSYTLSDESDGQYLLQLFNYEPGFRANYLLTIEGATGQILSVTDNVRPESAFAITDSATSLRGSIGPGREATFNYFLLRHPGDDAAVTVRLMVDAAEGLFDKSVGFNLYNGPNLAGQAMATLSSKGDKWIASFTITEASMVTYGIQVFNYSTSALARYSLYVTGL